MIIAVWRLEVLSHKIVANIKTPWLFKPAVDLVIGCGAWTVPLFILTALMASNHGVALTVAFYGLSLVFNYPHYMATIYRAYHRRADFTRYRRYTLHASVIIFLVLILGHWSFHLIPWFFTVYVMWSPWHYSGQNYGLALMFIQRTGAKTSATQKQFLKLVFISSYAMLVIGFLSQQSVDPIVISFGFPAGLTYFAQWAFFLVFAVSTIYTVVNLRRQPDGRNLVAPLTLILSQFLWFVMPVLVALISTVQLPPVRYSSGILAILHSAQYLWITTYFARRESLGTSNEQWRPGKYLLTIVAGGIALFLPGPWLVSYIGHYDFTTSFIIFTALMNIHHFVLDGVVWKLREPQVASVLIAGGPERATETPAIKKIHEPISLSEHGRRSFRRKAGLAAAAVLLIGLGIADLCRFYLGADVSKPEKLAFAAKLNPNDSLVQSKLAQSGIRTWDIDGALISMQKAVDLNPKNPVTQNALAQMLIENQHYVEALRQYQRMRQLGMMDVNALVNYGILASDNKQFDEAISSWTQALKINPNQLNAQLYLAEILNQQGQVKESIPHYEKYLTLLGLQGGNVGLTPELVVHVASRLADAYDKQDCPDCQERAREYRKKADQFTALAKEIGQR